MAGKISDHDVQNQLVEHLLDHPECFGHTIDQTEHIETHISHLLLVGDFVYKIKKPLNLGFLDFSTLEKRHRFCLEELRLNQRLAPTLYKEVVVIGGSLDQPEIGGGGEPLEYAVKMSRFKQQDLFDQRSLDRETIDELAQLVAEFHQNAAVSTDSSQATAAWVMLPVMENFRIIRELKHPLLESERLNNLQTWTEQQVSELDGLMQERHLTGKVRECHGDLHLSNIALYEHKITPFDGIEFNPTLRWIDTLSDIAFLLMDLQHRGLSQSSDQLLNRYLEETGDYAGLPLLRFYLLYRAMVRAKVSAIRITQSDLPHQQQPIYLEEYLSYLSLAESVIRHPPASLVITCGLSGSGKSTVSGQLSEQLMAIRLRSDVERKRLFSNTENSGAKRYSDRATQITYAHLCGMARRLLQAGFSVTIDASCLMQWQRQIFTRMAESLQAPVLILECKVRDEILEQRILARNQQGVDASEADLDVLSWQKRRIESLTEKEQMHALTIDTESFPPPGFLATVLQRLML
ncbi:MAG: AAA family ATPase [Candidatus Thiodiazotropha sp. L084R]